jgi:hypothetical protein
LFCLNHPQNAIFARKYYDFIKQEVRGAQKAQKQQSSTSKIIKLSAKKSKVLLFTTLSFERPYSLAHGSK